MEHTTKFVTDITKKDLITLRLTAGGIFSHQDTNVVFQYYTGVVSMFEHTIKDATHTIIVSEDFNCPYRAAKIKKTVAYIAVDEDEYGNTIWEKWPIKKHKYYPQNINSEQADHDAFVYWLKIRYPDLFEYYLSLIPENGGVIGNTSRTKIFSEIIDFTWPNSIKEYNTIWKSLSKYIEKNEHMHEFWML